jgi:hypothetical protein
MVYSGFPDAKKGCPKELPLGTALFYPDKILLVIVIPMFTSFWGFVSKF